MFTRLGMSWMRIGSVVLLLNLAWQAWDSFKPHPPSVSAARAGLVKRLMPTLVEDLRVAGKPFRKVALLRLKNDPSGYVTTCLHQALDRSGIFRLRPRGYLARLKAALRIDQPGVGDLSTALRDAQGWNAVIFGTIHRFYSAGGAGRLDMSLNLADVANGRVIFSRRFRESHSQSRLLPVGSSHALSLASRFRRFLAWAITVLLLPVFTIGFIRATARKKSNRANALALAIYTAVDTGLAALLVGISSSSWFSIVFFLLMAAAATAYNVTIMTFATRLEE